MPKSSDIWKAYVCVLNFQRNRQKTDLHLSSSCLFILISFILLDIIIFLEIPWTFYVRFSNLIILRSKKSRIERIAIAEYANNRRGPRQETNEFLAPIPNLLANHIALSTPKQRSTLGPIAWRWRLMRCSILPTSKITALSLLYFIMLEMFPKVSQSWNYWLARRTYGYGQRLIYDL